MNVESRCANTVIGVIVKPKWVPARAPVKVCAGVDDVHHTLLPCRIIFEQIVKVLNEVEEV